MVDLDRAVTSFHVAGPYIDCICGKELLKVQKDSGKILRRKEIFEKEGFSRKLIADGGQIFIYDFCMLYALDQESYELLGKWQLGGDLRSDLCGLAADQDTVYSSIRNGKIITLDRRSYFSKEVSISDSSMWSVKTYQDHLVCGTVGGELLLLDKTSFSVEKTLVLGKKNVGSLYLHGNVLYAAVHDGKLYKIDVENFTVSASVKNAHKKMFHCVGVYQDMLVTVSYPCSEIALWDQNTLEKRKLFEIPLRLSGHAEIEEDDLYISSRNILGIDRIRLNQQVNSIK